MLACDAKTRLGLRLVRPLDGGAERPVEVTLPGEDPPLGGASLVSRLSADGRACADVLVVRDDARTAFLPVGDLARSWMVFDKDERLMSQALDCRR